MASMGLGFETPHAYRLTAQRNILKYTTANFVSYAMTEGYGVAGMGLVVGTPWAL